MLVELEQVNGELLEIYWRPEDNRSTRPFM